ncbi:CCA tRNA nucleotidyltransferase, mitochondrial [Massospora cicadina]|nr:CCA tRNA nucleotidyltransferase, mitochondrial [Massospora cicadina]
MGLVLNDRELELRNLLITVSEYIATRVPNTKVVVRFAGGWVRDKLLGVESHDIDVAIDTLTGSEFFNYLQQYEATLRERVLSRGTTIAANPIKSKHLETCTTQIFGLEIDFVNLRSERYTEASRVPTMVFGTPEEDAYRRDITINSLFYNIHTDQVEDFCGRGLADLRDRWIRTPLPPKQTFIDDPLRVLRCIRFASRLNFEVAQEVVAAMSDAAIKAAFKTKISRERVGVEILKMLEGDNPLLAFELIYRCGWYETIFYPHPPREEAKGIASPSVGLERARIMGCLLGTPGQALELPGPLVILIPKLAELPDVPDKGLLMLASFLTPFEKVFYTSPKNKKSVHSITPLAKDTLKIPSAKGVAVEAYFRLSSRLSEILSVECRAWTRSFIGLFMHEAGPRFTESVMVWLTGQIYRHSVAPDPGNRCGEALGKQLQRLQALLEYVKVNGLLSAHTLAPIITGDRIAKVLAIKPGVVVGHLKQEAFVWQLEHPEGTPEECETWLLQTYGTPESRELLSTRYVGSR